jgi:hypothetical protein
MWFRKNVAHDDHDTYVDPAYEARDTNAAEATLSFARIVTGVAIIALIVLQLLLLARLSFQMAEANPQNDFVDAVYDTSDPFVEPFEDILTVETLDDGGVFDPNILIAMGVYLVAAMIVLALLWALVSPIATNRVDRVNRVDTTRGTHQH